MDFTKTFFAKHSLLAILTKYCVFTENNTLLVMRPYQIAATEKILNKIAMAKNNNLLGTIQAGGYIWHTTGSGKTLTSFKTAILASKLDNLNKVIFVVDRKDLDHQTVKEYDNFEKGAASHNISTKILTKQLTNSSTKIVITTIQKLARFIDTNKNHDIFNKHVVLIFDECHRSQFGEMHSKIIKSFKQYNIFGFTGTPIFPINSSSANNSPIKITEQIFGKQLHSYTIVDAINDENVLPFKIDYLDTVKMKANSTDKQVQAIDSEAAAGSKERISKITDYIINHFATKTLQDEKSYSFNTKEAIKDVNNPKQTIENTKKVRLKGFNSIFAVSSIEMAKKYYAEFKLKNTRLKVALIYSFGANEPENEEGILADEDFDMKDLDKSSRDFLEGAIADYNNYFGMSFDTTEEKFETYYKNISQRMKNKEIDILIVVNMFLTGFDATTLNTLWVDKNLRYHGLIQAFSRTNRILNSIKKFGNIICFRKLEEATNKALAHFGNKEAGGIVLLKSYKDYYEGYDKDGIPQKGYKELVAELQSNFSIPVEIQGEQAEKDFINSWNNILRMQSILNQFEDDFKGNEILTERDIQDYRSEYLRLYNKLGKNKQADKENITNDIEFDIELFKQVTISIDYILSLVHAYNQTNQSDKEILITIDKSISSSTELYSKKDLIEDFMDSFNSNNYSESDLSKEWIKFATNRKNEELEVIIKEEKLKPAETRYFMEEAFKNGEIITAGTSFRNILPPVDRFAEDNIADKNKDRVLEKLQTFFEKYLVI